MRTYLDEAGVFIVPNSKKRSAVSCVGGLSIPEVCFDDVCDAYLQLKLSWGLDEASECKGRQLDEGRVFQVIDLLRNYPVVFCAVAIDMATQDRKQLQRHKQLQGKKFTERLDERFHPNLVAELNALRAKLEDLSLQLYVQSVCSSELLAHILQITTLRYSLELPEALGDFCWIIDAKNEKITPFEQLWIDTVTASLQAKSFRSPLIQIEEGDYSHFEKFCAESPEAPEHIRDFVQNPKPFSYIDTNRVFDGKISFVQSETTLGVQLADILTTSLRRAMNGNLRIEGWRNLGCLMVTTPLKRQAVQLIDLSQQGSAPMPRKKPPYWEVVPHLDSTASDAIET